jgi:hypothetical protein
MSNTKTPVKFSWTDENKAIVKAAYADKIAVDGLESANETTFLNTVAKSVGAASGASVRSQLVAQGVYSKGEIKKVGGPSAVRKAHYIRAIEQAASENGVTFEKGEFDSLEHSKADALKLLVNLIPSAPEKLESLLKA